MLTPPFELVSCSWPRPVAHAHGRWLSEPDWDAPPMPFAPQPHWEVVHGRPVWLIDWRETFKLRSSGWGGQAGVGGEMRGFHVVFRIRARASGGLVFWDDDGSVIRRGGMVVHDDRSSHALARAEVHVEEGDVLEVGHWQQVGGWVWGAQPIAPEPPPASVGTVLRPFLGAVEERLRHPDGPALKFYTHGATPLRAAAAVYSLILNGYAPSGVLLFGDHQWSAATRAIFAEALPFAQVVTTDAFCAHLRTLGGPRLAEYACGSWFVMKACIALLYPPKEFCVLDDDLFVIDSVADALEHFRHADLVFAPDADHGGGYANAWGRQLAVKAPMPTGTFNAGLYWCRQVHDSRRIAGDMLRSRPAAWMPFLWEQGFIASTYARSSVVSLPSQRYLFPVFDGLPGGMLGYDYANNPCGLASVHFGGLGDKPSDAIMAYLAPEILGRNSPPWTASAVDVALGSEAEAVLSGTEQHAEPAAL